MFESKRIVVAHIKEILTEERITYQKKTEVSEHCF